MSDELKNGISESEVERRAKIMQAVGPGLVAEAPSDRIHRYELVISRTVLVYATDEATAHARALQVDGVAGRYSVVSCVKAPFSMEPKTSIIDRAPSRETQK